MTKRFIAPFLFFIVFAVLPAILHANGHQDTVYTIRTVVLDAGHGGNKSGTSGAKSLEKDVVLQVVLKLGKAIEKEMPGVKVLYTRTTDVDVDLYKRIEFANKHHADLFISVHCNATPIKRGRQDKTVRGTETFVSGFSRLGEQDAAIRENADILLEDNYEENYQGFDPNDPASYIVFSLMKNQYRDQSIKLASYIQDEYAKLDRVDRGVQELSLAVLARAGMPAVLTEIGFLSNPNEETYMLSAKGQQEIVGNLVDAIKSYKKQVER
ncbi:N-acetylmuramoyl-L-alanine amidase family protein [Parapedobacter sp. 10938]|uniref:N-acetylmuramoyl-L-alanine amidase family protein n=1 Tax=Parapedobacter flavus TaxID=3110225 RepID=UPI002DB6BF3E|nr:N-acetylmuramoyl-L-alanine amidase [Parapedobacter sp. 10938]MEC3880944.1 N-acetylmuramoyl-L-alanine amidase [Parapedobacter sp. 10938]